jgi:hypothetical protein
LQDGQTSRCTSRCSGDAIENGFVLDGADAVTDPAHAQLLDDFAHAASADSLTGMRGDVDAALGGRR